MKQLRAIRKRMNMTQQQLADVLGVSRTTVTMWETSPSMPSARMLVKLADALDVTVDELLGVNEREETE